LAELGGLVRGTLVVQASQTISSYWLPRHLVAFRLAHPGVEVRLTVGNTLQVAGAVHDGAAELGFVEGAVNNPALDSTTVARDRLVIVVAPGHPWAATRTGRDAITPADLSGSPWVLREPGSGTRSAFEAALEGFGLFPQQLQVALELPTNEAVRAAVEAGAGATALSASVVAGGIEAGLLVRAGFELPDRDFHVLRHRERYRSRAADALMAVITGNAPARA
jgi:DNA-binding transcriptional LysR family regulator